MEKLLRIIPFVFLLAASACNNAVKETSETGDTAIDKKEETSGALGFTVKGFKLQLTPGCDSCPQVTASIPLATGNEQAAQKINNSVLAAIADAIGEEGKKYPGYDSLFTGFMDNYKKMKAELPGSASIGWEATIKGNIIQQTDSLINIKLEIFVFTGGAHPNTNTLSLLFDPATGSKLTIVNLVTNLHSLTRLAEIKFREQYKIPAKASINATGFMFDKKRFVLSENIFFTSEGLLLHYNAYEIAPYVMGPQEVTLPYAEVKPYLSMHF